MDTLYQAFADDREPTDLTIAQVLNDFVPLSKLMSEQIGGLEQWAKGKPVNGQPHRHTSPLLIAIDKGFHSLVELFVKNGADLSGKINPLQRAVARQNPDIVELLIRFGADVRSVDFAYVCRFGPHPQTLRLFMDNGADFRAGYPIAHAFQEGIPTMLGLYKTYVGQYPEIQKQADMALRYHSEQGNMGSVCRLLWAGGNPRAKVPETDEDENPELFETALEAAAYAGQIEVMQKLAPDPARDDLDDLLHCSCIAAKPDLIRYLIQRGADPNNPKHRVHNLVMILMSMGGFWGSRSPYADSSAESSVRVLLEHGMKLEPITGYELSSVRRDISKATPEKTLSLIALFKKHAACSDKVLIRLVNTAPMRIHLRRHEEELLKLLPALKDRAVPQRKRKRKKRRRNKDPQTPPAHNGSQSNGLTGPREGRADRD